MTEERLERRLRAWYEDEIGRSSAPTRLRETVLRIPAGAARPRRSPRPLALLAAAAMAAGSLAALLGVGGGIRMDPAPARLSNGAIAFVDLSESISVVDPEGASERRLVDCDRPCALDAAGWSPDGTRLVYSQSDWFASDSSLSILDVTSGSHEEMTRCDHCARFSAPAFSPDGRSLAYAAIRLPDTFFQELDVIDEPGSPPRRIVAAGGDITGFAWSPEGRTILVRKAARNGAATTVGIIDVQADEAISWLLDAEPYHSLPVAVAPMTGRLAFPRRRPGWAFALFATAADGTGEELIAELDGEVTNLAWSPDETEIAFVAGCRIGTLTGDGSARTIVHDASPCGEPPAALTWSPDATRLAFILPATDGRGAVFVVDRADGSAIEVARASDISLAWQPLPDD